MDGRQVGLDEIMLWIREELNDATSKFPDWPEDIIHAFGILSEEVGELQKEVNEITYESRGSCAYHFKLGWLRKEAIQSAAMAIRFMMHLNQYKYPKSKQIKTDVSSIQKMDNPPRMPKSCESCKVAECHKGTKYGGQTCISRLRGALRKY
jgi:hypothetical protein